jgi:hypothetical protein
MSTTETVTDVSLIDNKRQVRVLCCRMPDDYEGAMDGDILKKFQDRLNDILDETGQDLTRIVWMQSSGAGVTVITACVECTERKEPPA